MNPKNHLILVLAVLILSVFAAGAAKTNSPQKKPTPENAPPATLIFPLKGDVYPSGLYFVAMAIGNPPKPYYLDIDTGSHLTWLQCDAPCVRCYKSPHPYITPKPGSVVPKNDPMCRALHSDEVEEEGVHVENDNQCDYLANYHDGSSMGVLMKETFPLKIGNSTIAPQLVLGCGYDQTPLKGNEPSQTDGLLGLGNGKISIVNQLSVKGITKNVVGHCLNSKGGGSLFFGDNRIPSSRLTWVPMMITPSAAIPSSYYSPGPSDIYWDKKSLGVRQQEVVFDSGATYTYFNKHSYQALLTVIKKDLAGTPLKEAPEEKALPVCWKGAKPFKSVDEVKKYFKVLVLHFIKGTKALFPVPPTNYLIITEHGNVCLGILDGHKNGLNNINVIGDISMLDMMVVYDNERRQIGWMRAVCNTPSMSGSSII